MGETGAQTLEASMPWITQLEVALQDTQLPFGRPTVLEKLEQKKERKKSLDQALSINKSHISILLVCLQKG